ncbi:MAG: uracil-DNA glycosylase [Solirubrobacteraceae bacterium]
MEPLAPEQTSSAPAGPPPASEPDARARASAQRREALKQVFAQARSCTRCAQLAESRTNVVFGAGNADADLMFVGEAPGAREDEQGLPFVGRAGKLLDTLLAEIGLARGEVFICNTLKCRPPGNRDPLPVEIENCREYLYRQVELIEPRVICTLGNFATKLLRGDQTGITRIHGRAEVHLLGRRAVRLYPIYHPAAALRAPAMLEALRADFALLPGLLAQPAPAQLAPEGAQDEQAWADREVRDGLQDLRQEAMPEHPRTDGGDQLDLF